MPTPTANYGLLKPLVNSVTDQDLWGGYLDDDMDDLDGLLKIGINWISSSKNSSFSITAPTSGSPDTGDSKALFLCDATGGAIIASLPTATSSPGMTIAIKKIDVSANTITLQGSGAELIDGNNAQSLSAQNDCIVVSSNGTSWDIVSTKTTLIAASTTTSGIVRLATNAESQAGTDATLATTPAGIRSLFTAVQLLSSTGYQEIPGGLIVQWGVTGSIPNASTSNISFPLPFPNNCWGVWMQPLAAGAFQYINLQGVTPTKTGFTLGNPTANPSTAVYWFTIGN